MKFSRLLALIGLLIILSGCLSDSRENSVVGFEVPLSGINIIDIDENARKIFLVDNQFLYEKLVSQYSIGPAEQIDFSTHRVLLLAMGQKPSGGYGIVVDKITENDGGLVIYAREQIPSKDDCFVAGVITFPHIFVKIPSLARIEQILIKEDIYSCSPS